MTRVLGVVAGLLWVAGIVVLIVGIGRIGDPVIYQSTHDAGAFGLLLAGDDHAARVLTVGTVLVGVAGVLTGGLVLRRRGRP